MSGTSRAGAGLKVLCLERGLPVVSACVEHSPLAIVRFAGRCLVELVVVIRQLNSL